MDYLLLNYVLYDHGEVTPHVAAGVNLNFWPVGSLLRRFGAFYIRRTFNNNRLYAVVFSEYVSFLLQRGAPLQFFLEGGRSRTGKLLHPKTGMVSMVFQSYMRSQSRPFYFLPVYIGYDNVMEVKSYRRELAGTKKQSESVGQLVKTRKALRRSHGQAYIGFGEPIDLGAFLDQEYPVWREQTYSLDSKPGWLSPAVNKLAFRVMKDINENAAVGPVAFTALILHASRTKAMAEEELVAHIELFLDILRRVPYSDSVRLPEIPARTIIERAEKFGRMNRFQHPGGDVIHLLEPQASYSIYVRNNIAHVFALPSLIAYFLQHNDHIADEFILRGCEMIYPVLKKEFFLRWESSEVRSVAKSYIEVFLELKLFERREDGLLTRPDVTRNEFTALRTLGLVIGAAVERYSVAVNLLHQYQGPGVFKAEEFQARCVMMAQRISLLTGATDSELPSAALFKVILDQLAEENHLEATSEGYRITPNFEQVYEVTSSLLSVDIRHSMSRVRK